MEYVKSTVQAPMIRFVSPDKIAIRLAIDEIRKIKAQEFERNIRCDKIKIFKILPIVPKRWIMIDK
jgi:hypothetical protein